MKSGWYRESHRHALASKGIKTGTKVPAPMPALKPKIGRLAGQADFYNSLWERNKGVFYRGTAGGSGLGFGVLGEGLYVTWEKGMANAFARIGAEEHGGKVSVKEIKLPRDLKLMDYQGKECWEIRKSMGVESRYDKIGDPMFAKLFTYEMEKKGFDGAISDDKADGIVIFDPKRVK